MMTMGKSGLVALAAVAVLGACSTTLDRATGTTLDERCPGYYEALGDVGLAGEVWRAGGGEPPSRLSEAARAAWLVVTVKCVSRGIAPPAELVDVSPDSGPGTP